MAMHTWISVTPHGTSTGPRQQVRDLLTHAWDTDPDTVDLQDLTTAYIDEINSGLPEHLDLSPFGEVHSENDITDDDLDTIAESITSAEENFGQLLSLAA